MVALGALSYLLKLDGQKSLTDHYNQTNQNFVKYFLGHAKVSDGRWSSVSHAKITITMSYTMHAECNG